MTDSLAVLEHSDLLAPRVLRELRLEQQQVMAGLPGPASDDVVLHGDPHAGNVLRRSGSAHWIDLEETCRGPVGWDLAILRHSDDGERALHAYASAAGIAVPEPEELTPWDRLRSLQVVGWLATCALTHPVRYAESARDQAEQLLARRPGP